MLISRFCQNSLNICQAILSGDLPSFRVCPTLDLPLPVFIISVFGWNAANVVQDYAERMRSLNLPLRLLTENEIFRLSVWGNPTNDARKGADLVGNTERTLLDVSRPSHEVYSDLYFLDLMGCNCTHCLEIESSNSYISY